MPIVPNALERLIFLNLNQAPGPMLDLWGAVAFRAAAAAVRLGVFDALAAGPLSAAELAACCRANEAGLLALLQFLETLGYVRQRSGRYRNTPMTRKWLTSASPANMAPGLRYWEAILSTLWINLDDSLRAGRPATHLYEWIEHQPETSRDFQSWMIALANVAGPEMVAKVRLPATAQRLLDVGGGHGMYSVLFCRRYGALTATVFDLPRALEVARENIRAYNLEGRVTLQPGDFMHDDLGQDYDIALLFNIIHGLTPECNAELFGRVNRALGPGGQIVIAEQLAGTAPLPIARTINALLRLSYFHLIGGSVYTDDDVAAWLSAAGFNRLRRLNLARAPGTTLLMATRAA